MKVFALINGDTVANMSVADESWQHGPEWVDVTELSPQPGIGWSYANGVFSPPPVSEVQTSTPKMTHYAFLRRLSLMEHVAIETAMATDVFLRVAKQRFDAAQEVDVSLDETQQFVGYLAQQGLIAPERVAELLQPTSVDDAGAVV